MSRRSFAVTVWAALALGLTGCAVDTGPSAPAYVQPYPYPYGYGPAYGGLGFDYGWYAGGPRRFYHHRDFDHPGAHAGHWHDGHMGSGRRGGRHRGGGHGGGHR